jgi:hypothetical protein
MPVRTNLKVPLIMPTQVKVWVLCWNCGNTSPNDSQMKQLVGWELENAGDLNKPDLIVIGVQEFPRTSKNLARRLASSAEGYTFIDRVKYNGWSGKRPNCQSVGALVKETIKDRVKVIGKGTGTRYWGKGGVTIALRVKGLNMAFISAHLDSYGKREADFVKITASFQELLNEGEQAPLDAIMMMGDLNFRLRPRDGSDLSPHNTRMEVAGMLFDDYFRNLLHQYDELNDASFVSGESYYKFVFPKPNFLPTYKIRKKYQGPGWTEDIGRVIPAYFGDGGLNEPPKIKKKRVAFDFGWLDRIGWATKWPGRPRLSGKAKVKLDDSFEESYLARHNIRMSDHAAVMAKILVTGQRR